MSNVLKLDAIREETVRRFSPLPVELSDGSVVELKPLLKLGEKAREEILAVVDEIKDIEEPEDDEDQEAVEAYVEAVVDKVAKVLKLVANKPKRLLAELDHEDPQVKVTLHTQLITSWIRRTQLGGSKALAGLIDKHGEAIFADLLHYYRVDLRDLFSDESKFSPRMILALILWLPTDSAFYASRQGGPQYMGWDPDRYAAVAAVNALLANNHIHALVNRDPKKPKPKAPEPFPTPGDYDNKHRPKPGSFAAIAASMMAAQRRKKELLNG
ncbi:tail assembly chaperone [Mycobacterium phage Mabel]|nr:tail assembly chaperone [Mycobacterium phage Mabel]